MHAGFMTQADRFADPNDNVPPPGAYEINAAFSKVNSRGVIPISSLKSKTERKLFSGTTYLLEFQLIVSGYKHPRANAVPAGGGDAPKERSGNWPEGTVGRGEA